MVSNFCKNHLASSPQSDFEHTVEQRNALMRVEVTRDQFITPTWEARLDMVARKEGRESQVIGVKEICEATYDSAHRARPRSAGQFGPS